MWVEQKQSSKKQQQQLLKVKTRTIKNPFRLRIYYSLDENVSHCIFKVLHLMCCENCFFFICVVFAVLHSHIFFIKLSDFPFVTEAIGDKPKKIIKKETNKANEQTREETNKRQQYLYHESLKQPSLLPSTQKYSRRQGVTHKIKRTFTTAPFDSTLIFLFLDFKTHLNQLKTFFSLKGLDFSRTTHMPRGIHN